MSQEFSVSMCVYGGDDPAFFDAALGSVVGQTVPPSEIVLTVDGPVPPDTEGVIGKIPRAACRVRHLLSGGPPGGEHGPRRGAADLLRPLQL